jgi:hypothetical protein
LALAIEVNGANSKSVADANAEANLSKEAAIIPVVSAIVLRVAVNVIKELIEGLFDFLTGELAEKEGAFVQTTLTRLGEEFPDSNLLVYHDLDSQGYFENYQYAHVQLDQNFFGTTKGYEIYVFDSGKLSDVVESGEKAVAS